MTSGHSYSWSPSTKYGYTCMRPGGFIVCSIIDIGNLACAKIYNLRTCETLAEHTFTIGEWGDNYLDQAKAWVESYFANQRRPPTPINAQIIAEPDHTATVQMLRSGQRVVVATIGQYGSLHQTIQIEAPLEIGEAISLLEFILWTQSNQKEQENG